MHPSLLILLALVALGVVLAVASALFSAIETSFFSLQPLHVERLKQKKARYAQALERLMQNPRRLLSAVLLSDAMVNLGLIILCVYLMRVAELSTVSFWVAALLIFALVVFLCDLVPKVLALAKPHRVVPVGVRVMKRVLPVVDPIARVLQRYAEWAAERVLPKDHRPSSFLNEEELATLVELSAEEGALHESESEMIQEIIKLGSKTVRDCMTPRIDAVVVPDDLTNEEVLPKLRASRRRLVPVYGDTPDEILGVLDARQFLIAQDGHYTEYLQPPSFVPETMKALDLLRNFLRHPQGLAVVVDEHGGTEGIITMTDLVEEIISDALPQGGQDLYIEPTGDGRLLVGGNARLEDLNESLGTELEADGIDTIGGLIFNQLGAVPKAGTALEVEGLKLTVRRASRRRIEELIITVPDAQTGAGALGEKSADQVKKEEAE